MRRIRAAPLKIICRPQLEAEYCMKLIKVILLLSDLPFMRCTPALLLVHAPPHNVSCFEDLLARLFTIDLYDKTLAQQIRFLPYLLHNNHLKRFLVKQSKNFMCDR